LKECIKETEEIFEEVICSINGLCVNKEIYYFSNEYTYYKDEQRPYRAVSLSINFKARSDKSWKEMPENN